MTGPVRRLEQAAADLDFLARAAGRPIPTEEVLSPDFHAKGPTRAAMLRAGRDLSEVLSDQAGITFAEVDQARALLPKRVRGSMRIPSIGRAHPAVWLSPDDAAALLSRPVSELSVEDSIRRLWKRDGVELIGDLVQKPETSLVWGEFPALDQLSQAGFSGGMNVGGWSTEAPLNGPVRGMLVYQLTPPSPELLSETVWTLPISRKVKDRLFALDILRIGDLVRLRCEHLAGALAKSHGRAVAENTIKELLQTLRRLGLRFDMAVGDWSRTMAITARDLKLAFPPLAADFELRPSSLAKSDELFASIPREDADQLLSTSLQAFFTAFFLPDRLYEALTEQGIDDLRALVSRSSWSLLKTPGLRHTHWAPLLDALACIGLHLGMEVDDPRGLRVFSGAVPDPNTLLTPLSEVPVGAHLRRRCEEQGIWCLGGIVRSWAVDLVHGRGREPAVFGSTGSAGFAALVVYMTPLGLYFGMTEAVPDDSSMLPAK